MKKTLLAILVTASLTASVATPPTITMVVNGGKPQLEVGGGGFPTNRVEFTHDFKTWEILTNVIVWKSSYTILDETATTSARFYRVVASGPTNMTLIPEGFAVRGDGVDNSSYSTPVHTNFISAFLIGRYEVTKALWDDVYNWATNHGYSFDNLGSWDPIPRPSGTDRSRGTNFPVHSISWYDMVKWCNALSEKEGRVPAYYTSGVQTNVYRMGGLELTSDCVNWRAGYRLPTGAEWEKAARGGQDGLRFPWGSVINWTNANYFAETNIVFDTNPSRGNNPIFTNGIVPFTSPVGFFPPNGYGIHDVSGNVSERVWDRLTGYTSITQTNPLGTDAFSNYLGDIYRDIRGGGHDYSALGSRVGHRPFPPMSYVTILSIGFRYVLPVP